MAISDQQEPIADEGLDYLIGVYARSSWPLTHSALLELLERRKADRWIPVTERFPELNKHGFSKYVWVSDGTGCVEALLQETIWRFSDRFLLNPVTHWRPLPAPPEVSNG